MRKLANFAEEDLGDSAEMKQEHFRPLSLPGYIRFSYDVIIIMDQASSVFSNRKDMTKTANITPALIRKVATPIELYENPPKVSPTILARPPKLPATPCTAP